MTLSCALRRGFWRAWDFWNGRSMVLAEPRWRTYSLSVLILALCAWAAFRMGSVSNLDLWDAVQLRLPRIILAAAVGMGLSVAGAVLQALFANPLCEPYTLGISSGATLGAVIGISLGSGLGFYGSTAMAFL